MSISSKQKLQRTTRFARGVVACFFLGAWSAGAHIMLTNVTVVNVTPSSFSVVGAVSPGIPGSTNLTISVFADPGGATNLAGQVGIEFYPLNSGAPTATNSYATLLSKVALGQESMALGLIYARVSYCSPNATYYYQVSVSDANGQTTDWPPSGPLPAVTTARENAFVVNSQQLLLTLNDANPPGSIITLSNENSSSVLAAVVGDGAGTNQAFFNLSDLIAVAGGTNYLPSGSQTFTATLLGVASTGLSETYSLILSNNFSVGQSSKVSLGISYTTVSLGTEALLAGTTGNVPIMVSSVNALVNLSFTLSLPTNLFTSLSVQGTSPLLNSASLQALSPNQVQLAFVAANGVNLLGSQQIAQLNFTTASNVPSAFVPLWPQSVQGTNADPTIPTRFLSSPGRIIIVGPQPVLEASLGAGGVRNLTLYGVPGASYQIQYATNLALAGGWNNLMRVPMTNLVATFSGLNTNMAVVFYRAYQFTADPPILEAHLANQSRSLLAYGRPGTNYVLQYSTNLSGVVAWYPLLNYTLTNSFQSFTNIGNTNPLIFYRLERL